MKISKQLQGGYLAITVMIAFCAGSGLIGFQQLSNSLDYVTGPVSETSDGAAKITRGIFEQLLSVEKILNNSGGNEQGLDTRGEDLETEAVEKLSSTGLLEKKDIDVIREKQLQFESAKSKLLDEHQQFVSVNEKLNANFSDFNELINQAKDGTSKALRDALVSLNKRRGSVSALGQEWATADLTKETQIYLLEAKYRFETILANNEALVNEELDSTMLNLEDSVSDAIDSDFFAENSVANGKYQGQNFGEAFEAAYNELNTNLQQAVIVGTELAETRKAYYDTSLELIELINQTESTIVSTIDDQVEGISATRSFLRGFIVFVALVSGALAAVIIVKVVNVIVKWLQQTQEIMAEMAEGRLNANLNSEHMLEGGEDLAEINEAIEKSSFAIFKSC